MIIGAETLVTSVLRDTFTVMSALVLIGTGHIIGSTAMEWFGFFMAGILSVSVATSIRKKNTYSGDAAIERVKELVKDEVK